MDKKNRRILFINLSLGVRTKGVNHGIAALAPILRRHSYEVSVLNLTEEIDEGGFLETVKEQDPFIVGFSGTTHQYKYLIKYSKILERLPQVLQIAGGVHITLDPLDVLSRTAIAGVCVGEGEVPLENLLNLIDAGKNITDAEGFYWKVGDTIKRNQIPRFVTDLSILDFPDYSVFDRDFVIRDWSVNRSLIVEKNDIKKYIEVMLSRGCPCDCHYCCNKALASVYPSPSGYFRLPSVEWSISFLQNLIRQYPEAQYIEFIDDLLIANTKWFLEFSRAYKENINLPYRLCGRFEFIKPEIVEALKSSGCVRILLGVESGDEKLRKELLNRHHTNELIIEKCKLIKESGITICSLNIVGFPFETKQQMKATLDLNRKISPQFGTSFFFHPYKGTYLYDICKKHGLLKSDEEVLNITSNYIKPFIKLTEVSEKECIKFQKKLSFFFFQQTCKYRLKKFISSRRGLKKLLALSVSIKLLVKGMRIYYTDYIRPKITKKNRLNLVK